MKDRRKRKLRKFRKRNILLPIIAFVLGFVLVDVVFYIVCMVEMVRITDRAIYSAIDRANITSDFIFSELDGSEDAEEIKEIIDNSETEMILYKDGETVYSNTDSVVSEDNVYVDWDEYRLIFSDEDMTRIDEVYHGALIPDTEDAFLVNNLKFYVNLFWRGPSGQIWYLSTWIPTVYSCDEGRVLIHTDAVIPSVEFIYALMSMAGVAFLLFLLQVLLFVNIILSYVRSNRMMNALYFDDKMLDRNWLFLTTNAEKMIKRQRGLFTVLSINFCKYNHIKSCVGAGYADDELLKMFRIVKKHLGRKDLIARFDDENIGVVFKRDLSSDIEKVVSSILNELGDDVYIGAYVFDRKNTREKMTDVGIEDFYYYAELARKKLNESSPYRVAYFDNSMREEYVWVSKVETRLDQAIANEELVLYVQPKYDPKDSTLKGAEALIKWNSPEEGLIQPGRFIPICEDNGSIVKIDDYMISHLAQYQADWIRRGFKVVPISVNVSRAHFIDPNLAEHICSLVDQYGTPHQFIEIELTESAFFDDQHVMLNTVNKLQAMGFQVSMDDFGSGYSSLNSLRELSLDVLKLDAGFFRGQEDNPRGELIVSRVIGLAKKLDMEIVAEGVERKEQVEFLADAGCDLIQGYYFDKPLDRAEFETRMTRCIAEVATATATATEAAPEVAAAPATNASEPVTQESSVVAEGTEAVQETVITQEPEVVQEPEVAQEPENEDSSST